MLFHSLTFGIFFVLVVSLYWSLSFRWQNVLLLLASYFFYGWWDWRFLPLLWTSTTVDYLVGRALGGEIDPRRRKWLLGISIGANLSMLGFFKYLGFFAGESCRLAGFFGVHANVPGWIKMIVLPVGISFYTFQTLSYTIDVYRRRVQPVRWWHEYALYHSFFPQLLAGPIERPSALLPQLLNPRPRMNEAMFSEGLYFLLMGLYRKLVVADNLAVLVNHIFSLPAGKVTALESVVGIYAFSFQIYGDFSGYSFIAQGISRWMGFELMWNFRQPYLATSPQTFWQRWHISLSTWMRDYVFMPFLTSSRLSGMARVYVATLVTWLVSGFWHGANWTFIVWGLIHGVYLCGQLALTRRKWFVEPDAKSTWSKRLPYVLITFNIVALASVFFRAGSLSQAGDFLTALIWRWHGTPLAAYGLAYVAFFAIPLILLEIFLERKGDLLYLLRIRWRYRAAVYSVIMLLVWFMPPENVTEFIYFQF